MRIDSRISESDTSSQGHDMQCDADQEPRKNYSVSNGQNIEERGEFDRTLIEAFNRANLITQDNVCKLLHVRCDQDRRQEEYNEFSEIVRLLAFAMKVDDRRTIDRIRRALGLSTKIKML